MFRLAFKKILNSLSRGTIRLAGAWTSKQKEYNALKSCPIHCARERPLTLMIKWTNKSSFFVSTQPKNNQRENLQLDYLALLYQFESCVQLFQHLIREVYRWMVEVQSTLDRCQLTKRERHQQSTSRIGRFHFDKPLAKSWLWSRTPAVERTNRGSRWKNMSEKTNTILFDDILLTILNIILNKSSICNCYGSPRTSPPYSPLSPPLPLHIEHQRQILIICFAFSMNWWTPQRVSSSSLTVAATPLFRGPETCHFSVNGWHFAMEADGHCVCRVLGWDAHLPRKPEMSVWQLLPGTGES